ncbi:peptidoglycan-binding domain-containing protein [Deinococcus budaensis]|uniref:Pyruvate/2-oxoglutarate dehydrogenase complex dihydrolipoamide acyltransferase (E2) component n=1 Tax=Deinococcus budaensis TaxID=1665626 RepID=A0A7W8GFI8_9DEIO|nr:peptidoglycan-binding domain-containing protein [Deinococcus budaensis]MBB5234630.1 pyruvate/2-oxoglutarate dehydrogenase complex dihydrolipoamide acyltransferase (E2) component [Deinococcus budaensis]
MKFAPLLVAALLAAPAPALAAPTGRDVERAATRAAQALDGVLRDCPASFARIGTPQKKCVGVGGTVEQARARLGTALGADLYGVWRSRDEQRSVYNWVRAPGGYVYLRLQPDPDGRAQTLGYFDTPPGTAPAAAAKAPAPPAPARRAPSSPATASAPRPPARTTPAPRPAAPPAPAKSAPTAASARSLAPQPFARTLQLQAQRLNGADVRAVQDRLIALTRPSGGGRGDGWYGPVTAATVRAFQAANGLAVTGRVDRATWDLLFSSSARTFAADSIR